MIRYPVRKKLRADVKKKSAPLPFEARSASSRLFGASDGAKVAHELGQSGRAWHSSATSQCSNKKLPLMSPSRIDPWYHPALSPLIRQTTHTVQGSWRALSPAQSPITLPNYTFCLHLSLSFGVGLLDFRFFLDRTFDDVHALHPRTSPPARVKVIFESLA